MMEWYHFVEGDVYYGPQWRYSKHGERMGPDHWAPWIPRDEKEIINTIVRTFGPLVDKKVRLREEGLDEKILKIALVSNNFGFGNVDGRALLIIDNFRKYNIYNIEGCYIADNYAICPEGSMITWDFFRRRFFQNEYSPEISLRDIIEAEPSRIAFYLFASAIADKLKPFIETRKREEMVTVFGKWYKFLSEEINHRIFLGHIAGPVTGKKRFAFDIVAGESLRILLNQLSLDEIVSLTEKFASLKSSNATYRYVLEKLIELRKKIDEGKLFEDLAEERIPPYEFTFCLERKRNQCIHGKTSVLYGLSNIFPFITEKAYWRIIRNITRFAPIVKYIYDQTSSENPLLYREVLRRMGINLDAETFYHVGRAMDILIFRISYVAHIESFLKENPNGTAEEFAGWYSKKRKVSKTTQANLKNNFRRYKEFQEDLRRYDINKLVREVQEYIRSIENWDEEIVSLVR